MGEWTQRALADLTDNFDGVRVPVKRADRRPGPYPYYGASGIVDYVDDYLFDGKYLLVAEDGENLRTRSTPVAFLARGQFWVNNHAHIMRGNSEADTRFLMYALSAKNISGYLTGSTMPKLTQGNMNRITLLTPPISEQRAIAGILGALDDKIELNRRINETLEAIARATFKSWFVDFDPMRSKMEGRKPYGMGAETAALFLDTFEDSQAGSMPKGWSAVQLRQFAEESRQAINPLTRPADVFRYYSIPAFDEGRVPALQVGQEIKSNKLVVEPGSVLLSRLNPRFPRVWFPGPSDAHTAISSTEFLVAQPKPPATREYLYALFGSQAFQDTFATLVTGTSSSHQRVRPEDVLSMAVVFPTAPVLQRFTEVVAPTFRRMQANLDECETLGELRDTLLPRLLSGEVRVKNTERASVEV